MYVIHFSCFTQHFCNEGVSQLWLDNRTEMEFTLSSAAVRISSALSSIYNSFLGQTRSQAQLNAIVSYDQSNELFKVCSTTDAKRKLR